MVEASLRVTPDMMLAPAMSQHEGGGLAVKFPQQKVPPEIEHCDSSGVFPTLVIGRQNCGHDGDDPIRLWSIYINLLSPILHLTIFIGARSDRVRSRVLRLT